jgi:hypothetical protein
VERRLDARQAHHGSRDERRYDRHARRHDRRIDRRGGGDR